MKRIVYCFLLIFLISGGSAFSNDQEKPRVGILQFSAKNVSEVEADAVGELFSSELVMTGQFDVVDRNNVESLLTEMDFQMSGCTDSSCAVEIGQILSLEYMVYGSVIKLGEIFAINVQMINVGTAQIVNTGREQFKSIEEAYDVIPKLVKAFVGTFGGGEYVAPVTGEDVGKTVSKRKTLGMIAFFGGIALGGGSVWPWFKANNLAYFINSAYDNYHTADYDEYEQYKQEYLDAISIKNTWLFSALAASVVGGAAIITGSILWFGPETQGPSGEEAAELGFIARPIPGGIYLQVEY
ncbi:MAG: hypothetical protein JW760_01360 [Spirochaetales bacterium]|nr:hypothetical protein [Spirochaetales bacterium]